MSEEVINYDGYQQSSWWQNKKRGLTNRYHKYKRILSWKLHVRLNKIEPDYTKIPDDSIPILINNFNRLDLLQQQIEWLLTLDGNPSIIIVDNQSDYPPLLDFYKKIDHPKVQVVDLKFNSWRLGAAYLAKKLNHFKNVIITDSDLLPYPNTPTDILPHLVKLMEKYPEYNHIGLSLEIEDLPDDTPMKAKVYRHESQFWSPHTACLNDEVYVAGIDTTFAMYRPDSKILATTPALRTVRPYTLQHVDWYLTPEEYSEEYQYYLSNCKSFATWATQLKKQQVDLVDSVD